MKIKLVLRALMMGMVVVLVVGPRAEATIFSFEGWTANNRFVDYLTDSNDNHFGSRINNVGPIFYEGGTVDHNVSFEQSNGWTPNITVTWSPADNPAAQWDTYHWADGAGDRGDVVQLDNSSPTDPLWVTFTPDTGWAVLINSFDLDEHNLTSDGDTVIDWEIFDDTGIMASGTWDDKNNANDPSNLGGRTRIYTGLTAADVHGGKALTLRIMQTSGNKTYTALDNLNFDQVIPLPVIETDKQTLTVNEQGPTSDSYTIKLAREPNQPTVTVTATRFDAQITVNGGVFVTLTFTNTNWDTAQTVTVAAVDDDLIELEHSSKVEYTIVSADSFFNNASVIPMLVNIIDNDVPGIILTETDGWTYVKEQGTTVDTYTFVLELAPEPNDITITVEPNSFGGSPQNDVQISKDGIGYTGGSVTLTFTDTSWDMAQTIYVKAVDDAGAEPFDFQVLRHTLTHYGSNYNWAGLPVIPDVTAYVGDNDTASVKTDDLLMLQKYDDGAHLGIDVSGNARNGRPFGNPNLAPGKMGTALNLDGDDYVRMDSVAQGITDEDITLSAWIKTTSSDVMNIMAVNTSLGSTPDNVLLLSLSNGVPQVWDDNGANSSTRGEVNDGDWHLLTYARNGDTGVLYVDGIPSMTHTPAINLSSDDRWSVGQEWDVGVPSGFWIGQLDQVSVWDRGLSLIEVQALYNSGNGMTIIDLGVNPLPGLLIKESDSTTDLEEGATGDSYTIELTTTPVAAVEVTIDPNEGLDSNYRLDLGSGPGVAITLTFTTAGVAQSVNVTALDDVINEVDLANIAHSGISNDGNYNRDYGSVMTLIIQDECGAWGYMPMDFNHDCYVDLKDFAAFATNWANCTMPQVIGCVDQSQ